jgi:hypothetical protein
MHFKTKVNESWPIATLDDSLKGKRDVKRVGASVTVTPQSLPKTQEIWAMTV